MDACLIHAGMTRKELDTCKRLGRKTDEEDGFLIANVENDQRGVVCGAFLGGFRGCAYTCFVDVC